MMNVEGNGKPWCYLINVEVSFDYMKKTKWIAIKQARGDGLSNIKSQNRASYLIPQERIEEADKHITVAISLGFFKAQ